MKRAHQVFGLAERKRIAEAVAAAEAKTSAEIVPVVATQSGRYDRAEDAFGLMLGLALYVAAWLAFQGPREVAWGTGYTIDWWHALLIVPAGFALGVGLASRVGWLTMLFTPAAETAAEVQRAARQAFFDQRVHHTAGSSGLLIYVSLLEHRAVVLADEEVTARLGQAALDEICATLTGALRKQPVPEALAAAIAQAGEKLGAVLPRQGDDRNELADVLVLVG
ncbi:MAG: hypothetical protein HS108_08820 [Planctomycetes bacterium]|jgi:putative membrane protein|nr:hypothetical protein [Planctomycetota bacterium]MCL4731016.1 hypothetical protein [Planctomycetota bacterium]